MAEDAAFAAIVPPVSLTVGVTVSSALAAFAPVPVARLLRWQLSGVSAIATFRIWVSANTLG